MYVKRLWKRDYSDSIMKKAARSKVSSILSDWGLA
jgi:hypothetical protein